MAAHVEYLLHLADNALILGQRNAEWCGHGPILEEDLALANNSLDLIGQARMLYQHVAKLKNAGNLDEDQVTEDTLAYFRNEPEFRNYTLLELPHRAALVPAASGDRDYAVTIVRNFLFSALMVLVWEQLKTSKDAQLAAIAAKSFKECQYHLRHAHDWLVRMGDGTEASHERVQNALNHLFSYTQEFWTPSEMEADAVKSGIGTDVKSLQDAWNTIVDDALAEATLKRPAAGGFVSTGKLGVHSEHLSLVLGEMQSLARMHPTAVW